MSTENRAPDLNASRADDAGKRLDSTRPPAPAGEEGAAASTDDVQTHPAPPATEDEMREHTQPWGSGPEGEVH